MNLQIAGRILATIFSLTFAVLLFPSIVGVHGVFKSSIFTMLGVGFIWFLYFMLGSLFTHIHEEGKKEGRDNNTDFV